MEYMVRQPVSCTYPVQNVPSGQNSNGFTVHSCTMKPLKRGGAKPRTLLFDHSLVVLPEILVLDLYTDQHHAPWRYGIRQVLH